MQVLKQSAWQQAQIESFLARCPWPMRLAVLDQAGKPRVCSLWSTLVDGQLWAVSHKNAKLNQLLKQNPDCGFEIGSNEAPYKGVRGQAVASIEALPEPKVLADLMHKHLQDEFGDFQQWLLARSDDEELIRLEIDWISAWDYQGRMQP